MTVCELLKQLLLMCNRTPPLPSEYMYPKFNTTLHTTISCPLSQPDILYETQYMQ